MSGGGTQGRRRAEARVGRVLKGKWRLDAVLGVGGLAAVYAATHRAGKRVAVKVLHPELAAHDEIRARFVREAHAANRVGHPGVVSVSDDEVTDEGEPFLVMDLLDGETFDARRKHAGGTLPPAEVLAFAAEVLEVLVAAHAKGILHRDLKPENLFVTREGRVMVLDFGIARLQDVSSGEHATQTGMVMGTPAFMPPEQARGRWELVEARSDLWALGATMFTLLSGKHVHGGLTTNEALAAAITRPAPPLRSAAPDAPEAAAIVVDRALAFEVGARWQDARAMLEAVRGASAVLDGGATATVPLAVAPVVAAPVAAAPVVPFATGEPEGTTAAPVASTEAGARRRERTALVAVGGVVAVLAVAAGVVMIARARGAAPAAEPAQAEAAAAAEAATQAPVAAASESAAPEPAAASPAEADAAPPPGTAAPLPARPRAPVVVRVPAKPAATAAPAATAEDPFATRKRP